MGRRQGTQTAIAKQFVGGSGCYVIRHSGKVVYVGQSKDLSKRWQTHNHREFVEYNLPDATVEIMPCEPGNLLSMEAALIKDLKPLLNGNDTRKTCRAFGIPTNWWWKKVSPEDRERMRRSINTASIIELDGLMYSPE